MKQYYCILRWFLLRQKYLFKDLWEVMTTPPRECKPPYIVSKEEWEGRQKDKGKWYDDYENSFPTLKRIKDEIKQKKLANADRK